MDKFMIEIPNDKHPHSVEAARWECTAEHQLTSFDDEGNQIATWGPTEWYRLIEQTKDGKVLDKYRNTNVPNPRYS